MARAKQRAPLQREPLDLAPGPNPSDKSWGAGNGIANGHRKGDISGSIAPIVVPEKSNDLLALIVCVGGIYASFLSWAVLQESITTTPYGPTGEKWTYSVVLNTIQSTFAAITGLLYLYFSAPKGRSVPSPFPSLQIIPPLLLVAVVSSLASPFGYASLAHIDYITYILAKSCKLLPVMFLHLTVFRKRYPLYKYLVVGLVTAGVAVFTLHHPSNVKKSGKGPAQSSTWGLFLLGINLLFDGLTNSTQDHIFSTFKPYTGPQMMSAQNLLSTLLTSSYLLLLPLLPPTLLSTLSIPVSSTAELTAALSFLQRHPAVLKDVLGFAACGAVGQIFIYATLARFSSLLLVTVTVTRKMLTMILSVLWFGHRLSGMQWVGVGLVFGGVGGEGVISRREKLAKEAQKKRKGTVEKKEL